MACGPSQGEYQATTNNVDVGQWSFPSSKLRYFRFVSDGPVRITLRYLAMESFEETLVFDVFRGQSLTILCCSYNLSIRALSSAKVRWIVAESNRHESADLEYNLLLDAGTWDSVAEPSLKPPAGASLVRIFPRTPDDFTLTLYNGALVTTEVTRDEQPPRGVPIGFADKVKIDAQGPVRVEYTIRV